MRTTLITCTGDRAEAFRLCERFVSRQTTKPSRWIVVDDGVGATQCTCGQEILRLPPMQGQSLNRNLLAALKICTASDEAIVIVEDDDWYARNYLETYVPYLERFSLVGQGNGIYYHVGMRRYRHTRKTQHASLCATMFRYELVPYVKHICKVRGPFIDKRLWRRTKLPGGRHLAPDQPSRCIGIKGMPGRSGIGVGHRATWMGRRGLADPDLIKLRQLIEDDADLYAKYYQPNRQS